VTVVEAPVIDRLAFEGNNKIKDEQLQQEIQSKARGTLSRATVQADVQRIIEVYHRNGRFDVSGRAENRRAAEQSRRPDLRGQGRARRPASRRSTSSAITPIPILSAERGDQDLDLEYPELSANDRRIRS
jgi:hypothetical protein